MLLPQAGAGPRPHKHPGDPVAASKPQESYSKYSKCSGLCSGTPAPLGQLSYHHDQHRD